MIFLWTYRVVLANNSLFLTTHSTHHHNGSPHYHCARLLNYFEAMNLLEFWTCQGLQCRCEFRLNYTVLSDELASTLQPISQSTRHPDEWLGGSHILTCLQLDIIFMRKNYFDVISHDHMGVNLIQAEIRPTCLNSCSALKPTSAFTASFCFCTYCQWNSRFSEVCLWKTHDYYLIYVTCIAVWLLRCCKNLF